LVQIQINVHLVKCQAQAIYIITNTVVSSHAQTKHCQLHTLPPIYQFALSLNAIFHVLLVHLLNKIVPLVLRDIHYPKILQV